MKAFSTKSEQNSFLQINCSFEIKANIFAVPKFMSINACVLAKNTWLGFVAKWYDIGICVVTKTHLNDHVPYSVVNKPNYTILMAEKADDFWRQKEELIYMVNCPCHYPYLSLFGNDCGTFIASEAITSFQSFIKTIFFNSFRYSQYWY